MNRWQTPTKLRVDHATLDRLGIWGKCPVTYSSSAETIKDLLHVAAVWTPTQSDR